MPTNDTASYPSPAGNHPSPAGNHPSPAGNHPSLLKVKDYFRRPRWWLELIAIAALYALYSAIRNSVGEVRNLAFTNGKWILAWEDSWWLAWERPLNRLADQEAVVAALTTVHYASLHFIVTPFVLFWVMVRRSDYYRRFSGLLILTTLIALIGFYTLPTAPPRMLTAEGFTDIMAKTGNWGWWPESGAPGSDAVSNQFAAMPSLHCAWALWCGIGIAVFARPKWVKVLGILYPFTTFYVVMATGNHYLLDVIAGIFVLALAGLLVYGRQLWRYWIARSV